MSEYLTAKALAAVLDRHLTERDEDAGCALRCGYDGDDRAEHLAESLMPAVTRVVDEAVAQALKAVTEALPSCGHQDDEREKAAVLCTRCAVLVAMRPGAPS